MMKSALLVLVAFTFASCAHKSQDASSSEQHSASSENVHAKAFSPEQIRLFEKAQTLREEGMRLLHSKDPRVKNPQKGFEKLLESANLGDPLAMDTIGGIYSSGTTGVPRSCSKAMEWFDKSAAAGYALAANNLAYLYVTCEDKKLRDPAKAEAILKLMFSNNQSMIAVLDTYAALMAEQGNFKQASSTMQVVIDLQELIESNPERIDESKQALALYKKNKKLKTGFDPKPETN